MRHFWRIWFIQSIKELLFEEEMWRVLGEILKLPRGSCKAIDVAIGWLLFCDSWGEHEIGNERFNVLNWFLQKHGQAMSLKLKEQAACISDICTSLHICELCSCSTKQCWSLTSGATLCCLNFSDAKVCGGCEPTWVSMCEELTCIRVSRNKRHG